MRHRWISSVAILLFFAATAGAQTDQTDDFVKTEMLRQHIPGLSVVVLKDGAIVKAKGYGLANMKLEMPASAETVYKIGSVSKQFIATGIMLLVQERRLSVDDPISGYLEATPPAWSGITIRHLLTHTSGIVPEAPGFDPLKVQSDADVIKSAYPSTAALRAGEKWEYSNTGYFALGEIIRKASGRSWTDYLNEKVFKPSGMNTTRPTNTTVRLPNLAIGYADNDKLVVAANSPALRPSGGFLSTVLDLAKWDAVLYTDSVLKGSTRSEMWTPVSLNDGTTYPYGFGWALGSVKGHKELHHAGGIPGFLSEFARFVDDRLTVVVLINLDDADVKSIALGIAAFYLPTTVATSAR